MKFGTTSDVASVQGVKLGLSLVPLVKQGEIMRGKH